MIFNILKYFMFENFIDFVIILLNSRNFVHSFFRNI